MFFDEINAKDNWLIQIFYDKKVVCQVATFDIDFDLELAVHIQMMTPAAQNCSLLKTGSALGRWEAGIFPKTFVLMHKMYAPVL